MQNIKLALPWKALHTPWCHIIFGLWRVSLAEYFLILRVYSHLLQMVQCIMATARTTSLQQWTRSKAAGMALLYHLICVAFVGEMIMRLAYVFELCLWCWFQNYVDSATIFNLGCNNFIWPSMYIEQFVNSVTCGMYVESCTILVICWRWFKILHDTWQTTGFIWTQLCACQRVSGDSHAWSCINWSVLWHHVRVSTPIQWEH
jgi:hypothetical protein